MEKSNTCSRKHRPLNLLRLVRGLICLVVFVSTAFIFLVYFAPPLAVILRFLSIRWSRKVTSFAFSLWLALWPFLFEKINRTKVVFYGDTVPSKERVMVIANHRTEVDWMYLWDLALRKGCLGHIKYVLKDSLMKLPVFGWGFHVLEFVPLQRKWESDEPVLRQMLSTFTDAQDPLWLAIFPEGTDFTEQKCKNRQNFAAQVGLPVLYNVLLPKTKGFCVCLEVLRGSLDAVYDVTIAYKNNCPSFLDNVFGLDPSEVHIHVRRIPVTDIPSSEADSSAWLIDSFHLKDKLLSNFKIQSHFPDPVSQEELSSFKCLANFMLTTPPSFVDFFNVYINQLGYKVQDYDGNVGYGTVFTLQNQCSYTVWPGTLSGNGAGILGDGGFVLQSGESVHLTAPPGWSGRFWGRTQCNFDESGNGKCETGDCGPLKCTGGGAPPVTLVEFTIGSTSTDKDFYDVSLVDGYNVGMGVKAVGGTGDCQYAGCVNDLNGNCPAELRVTESGSGSTIACKSACAAFNAPEFCCTGDHATPQTCSPTQYSAMFKSACPTAYSYAYDDASSTCTCSGKLS
uniref:1-acylglycerol-3-phosphate O-acyltransferase n=1 Tax=Cannabis sativa TaxID=3483 RepID=A0A803NMW9_CANSA